MRAGTCAPGWIGYGLLRTIGCDVVSRDQVGVSLISTSVEICQKNTHPLQQRRRPLPRHPRRMVIPLVDPADEQAPLGDRQPSYVVGESCERAVLEQVLLDVRGVEG